MKKIIRTVCGSCLVALGAIFILLPGPSLILMIPGFMLLSYDYPIARKALAKCQKLASRSAAWMDNKLSKAKHFK